MMLVAGLENLPVGPNRVDSAIRKRDDAGPTYRFPRCSALCVSGNGGRYWARSSHEAESQSRAIMLAER